MNIKEKISKINNKIENIKEWQWLLITFFVCLVFIISLSPEIIWQPFIHAEDGPIFLKEALEQGVKSIFNLFGGYFGVTTRIFSLIAIAVGRKFNSFIAVTYVMKITATIYTVIAVNYFNSKYFKGIIKSRVYRLAISVLLMMVVANHGHMLYTSIMEHWWGDLLILLVGINFATKKMPPLYILPIVILQVLSSPVAILIVIPITYYIICKIIESNKDELKRAILKNKIKITMIILIFVTSIVEAYGVLVLSKNENKSAIKENSLSVNYISKTIERTLCATAKNFTYVMSFCKPQNEAKNKVYILVGSAVILMLLWRYCKNKNINMFLWGLIIIMGIYFMVYFKQDDYFKLPSDNFYNSIPAATIALLLIKWIYDDLRKIFKKKIYISRIATIVLLITLNVIFYQNTIKPNYESCKNLYEVEKDVDFSSSKIKVVSITPHGEMSAYVPVKDNNEGE